MKHILHLCIFAIFSFRPKKGQDKYIWIKIMDIQEKDIMFLTLLSYELISCPHVCVFKFECLYKHVHSTKK